jgi:hypothetical protein
VAWSWCLPQVEVQTFHCGKERGAGIALNCGCGMLPKLPEPIGDNLTLGIDTFATTTHAHVRLTGRRQQRKAGRIAEVKLRSN